jgi:hypothetical protein
VFTLGPTAKATLITIKGPFFIIRQSIIWNQRSHTLTKEMLHSFLPWSTLCPFKNVIAKKHYVHNLLLNHKRLWMFIINVRWFLRIVF